MRLKNIGCFRNIDFTFGSDIGCHNMKNTRVIFFGLKNSLAVDCLGNNRESYIILTILQKANTPQGLNLLTVLYCLNDLI